MRRNYCDICCKEIKPADELIHKKISLGLKKEYLEAHRKGRFNVDYARAVVNNNGEVIYFDQDYQFALCLECQDRIEKAIWAEVEKMTSEIAGKEVHNTFVAPQFPQVPELEEIDIPSPTLYTNG